MQYGHDTIVIGASAGGLEPLSDLIAQFPSGIKASVFIVKHVSAEAPEDILVQCLRRVTPLAVHVVRAEEPIVQGTIYVAPPGKHMLVHNGMVIAAKGPRENGMRPSIDAMFRSAAASHGSRVVGVILSGLLYDGSAGMDAIRRSSGKCLVQDPQEALYPDMPQSAMEAVVPDAVLPAAEIGKYLVELTMHPAVPAKIPKDIIIESQIAARVLASIDAADQLGDRSPFTCPDCGGGLWKIKSGNSIRYRCQTGHAYNAKQLLHSQADAIEEVLWIALRMFEERRAMYTRLVDDELARGSKAGAWDEKIKDTQYNIDRIRQILITAEEIGEQD
jgi:two-component system chemotaxis response regulator CheB